MTIIFLDIDGVLVAPASSFRRARAGQLAEPRAAEALKHLIAETGARLVLTSSWRLEYTGSELAHEIQQWLDEYTSAEPNRLLRHPQRHERHGPPRPPLHPNRV